jgi:hypothetical protein
MFQFGIKSLSFTTTLLAAWLLAAKSSPTFADAVGMLLYFGLIASKVGYDIYTTEKVYIEQKKRERAVDESISHADVQ